MQALYRHPVGEGKIFFEASTSPLFTSTEAEGFNAYALIRLIGMRGLLALWCMCKGGRK